MSVKGKLGCYSVFGLLVLALVYTLEAEYGADLGVSIPSEIKGSMNVTTLLLVAVLAVLFVLHLWSDDDDEDN